MIKIQDVMKTLVRTVHIEAPIRVAVMKMQANGIRHLVVLDDLSAPAGVLSQRDALRHLANSLIANVKRPAETPCGEVMVTNPRTVGRKLVMPRERWPQIALAVCQSLTRGIGSWALSPLSTCWKPSTRPKSILQTINGTPQQDPRPRYSPPAVRQKRIEQPPRASKPSWR